LTTLESNASSWTNLGTQQFINGPFQMAYDSTGHILYAASWNAGLLALKLSP
jgi:hypothetical protein